LVITNFYVKIRLYIKKLHVTIFVDQRGCHCVDRENVCFPKHYMVKGRIFPQKSLESKKELYGEQQWYRVCNVGLIASPMK
jgi:hypothetical protein